MNRLPQTSSRHYHYHNEPRNEPDPLIIYYSAHLKGKKQLSACYVGLFTETPQPTQVLCCSNVPPYHKGRIARKPPHLWVIVPVICTAHPEVTEKRTSQPTLLLTVSIRASSSSVCCSFFSFAMDNRRS